MYRDLGSRQPPVDRVQDRLGGGGGGVPLPHQGRADQVVAPGGLLHLGEGDSDRTEVGGPHRRQVERQSAVGKGLDRFQRRFAHQARSVVGVGTADHRALELPVAETQGHGDGGGRRLQSLVDGGEKRPLFEHRIGR
jgi:hypothetical protein